MQHEPGPWATGPPTDPNLAPVASAHRPARRWPWLLAVPLAVVLVGSGSFIAIRYLGQRASSHRGAAGGSTTATSLALPVGRGFLATSATSVVFVQWTDEDGSLSGSAQLVSVEGQPPDETTASSTVPVTGRLSGSTLSLSFGANPAVFGTVSDGGFTLDVPEPDGILAPLRFAEADASAFDAAVRSLDQAVAGADTVAEHLEALRKLEGTIDAAAAAVSGDLDKLASDEKTLAADVQAISGDLETEANDLARTKRDEEKVVAEAEQHPGGDGGQVCVDADEVATDAEEVGVDAGGVGTDAQTVESDLSTLHGDLSGLRADLEALAGEEAKLAGYVPASAPSSGEISQARSEAMAAIDRAVSTTNADIDEANAGVVKAFDYAAQAFQAGGCGEPPTAPAPIQHVS